MRSPLDLYGDNLITLQANDAIAAMSSMSRPVRR